MNRVLIAAGTAALLLPLLTAGCGDTIEPPGNPDNLPYWSPLYLPGDDFVDLLVAGGSLYAADRTQGVYVQRPAFSGTWTHLGMEVLGIDDPLHTYGITSLASDGDLLVVGLNLPVEHRGPRLYRRRIGEADWTASPIASESLVRDLVAVSTGRIVGLQQREIFSSDNGSEWSESEAQLTGLEVGSLFQGPDGLYCGGHGSEREPKLFRSRDQGESWDPVLLGKTLGIPVGTIYAMAGVPGTRPSILLTVDADVYRSDDGGATFDKFLEIPRTPGQIHVNPSDPGEIVVTGGELFWTRDGGASWRLFQLPRGLPIRFSSVDWSSRKMAITTGDGLREAVYAFDFEAAEAAILGGS